MIGSPKKDKASIVHPFNNNWNSGSYTVRDAFKFCFNRTSFQQQLKQVPKTWLFHWEWLQSYILSTTTETGKRLTRSKTSSTLQSYILSTTTETISFCVFVVTHFASIVHPFNNNWNSFKCSYCRRRFASIVHPFNNNWNPRCICDFWSISSSFNRTSFQQQLKHAQDSCNGGDQAASIVHPFNNNWNFISSFFRSYSLLQNRTYIWVCGFFWN